MNKCPCQWRLTVDKYCCLSHLLPRANKELFEPVWDEQTPSQSVLICPPEMWSFFAVLLALTKCFAKWVFQNDKSLRSPQFYPIIDCNQFNLKIREENADFSIFHNQLKTSIIQLEKGQKTILLNQMLLGVVGCYQENG